MIALCSARVISSPGAAADTSARRATAWRSRVRSTSHRSSEPRHAPTKHARPAQTRRHPGTDRRWRRSPRRLRPCGSSAGSWPRTAPLDSSRSQGRVRGLAGGYLGSSATGAPHNSVHTHPTPLHLHTNNDIAPKVGHVSPEPTNAYASPHIIVSSVTLISHAVPSLAGLVRVRHFPTLRPRTTFSLP